MAQKSKYKKKFADELIAGLRRDPKATIMAVCQLWNITRTTYYNWLKENKYFSHAHEIGERDYQVATHSMLIDIARGDLRGNAGIAALVAKNVLGWSDKVSIEAKKEEEVNTININVLPPVDESRLLEFDEAEDAEFTEIDS